jgi:hypothetical protein
LKATQFTLQKKITWRKKLSKGCANWEMACCNASISHQKLKTLMKTMFARKMILFKKTLEYHDAINFCCERPKLLKLQGQVP